MKPYSLKDRLFLGEIAERYAKDKDLLQQQIDEDSKLRELCCLFVPLYSDFLCRKLKDLHTIDDDGQYNPKRNCQHGKPRLEVDEAPNDPLHCEKACASREMEMNLFVQNPYFCSNLIFKLSGKLYIPSDTWL